MFLVMLVDADDGGMIAAANAGDVANLNEIRRIGVLQLQRFLKLPRSVEVAAHVVAHAHIDANRRLQAEVRIEAGDGMNVLDADVAARGDALDLANGNEADLFLHVAQIFEDTELVAARFDACQDFGHGAHRTFAPASFGEGKCS